MANSKIQQIKLSDTVYDIDLPPTATPTVNYIRTNYVYDIDDESPLYISSGTTTTFLYSGYSGGTTYIDVPHGKGTASSHDTFATLSDLTGYATTASLSNYVPLTADASISGQKTFTGTVNLQGNVNIEEFTGTPIYITNYASGEQPAITLKGDAPYIYFAVGTPMRIFGDRLYNEAAQETYNFPVAEAGNNNGSLITDTWLTANSYAKTTDTVAAAKKLGSTTVGSGTKPIYLSSGTATASASTVGGTAKPIYMNSGTLTALSSTIGSYVKPVYLSSGSITACSGTVGSTTKPVYMSSGALTALSQTVGSTAQPVYLKSGEITACSATAGSTKIPSYMSSGMIVQCSLAYENSLIAPTSSTGLIQSLQAGTIAFSTVGSSTYGIADFANTVGCAYIRFGKITKTSGSKSTQNVTFPYLMKGAPARSTASAEASSSQYKIPTNVSVILQDGSGAAASEWSNSHRVDSCDSTGFKWSHGASEAITLYYIAIGSCY